MMQAKCVYICASYVVLHKVPPVVAEYNMYESMMLLRFIAALILVVHL